MKTKNENAKSKDKKKKILNIVVTSVQVLLIVICLVASVFIIINPSGYRNDEKDCNTNMMVVMSDSMKPTIGTDAIIFGSKVDKENLELGTVVTFSVPTTSGYFLNTHRLIGYVYSYTKNESGTEKIYYDVFYYIKGEQETYEQFQKMLATKENGVYYGYRTRGDKYTLENNASLTDTRILKSDGTIDYTQDDQTGDGYLKHEKVLAVWKGGKIEGVGKAIKWLQVPLHFGLCILLPLVLLFIYNIVLVVKMIIADKSEKAKKAALEELKKSDVDEEEIKRKAIEEYLASLKKDEEKKAE